MAPRNGPAALPALANPPRSRHILMAQSRRLPRRNNGRANGGASNMAFFTDRERAALGKSLDVKVQGKVRELVRQEFGPRRRRPAEPNSPEDAGPMMRRRP